jgi:hypothetical protein
MSYSFQVTAASKAAAIEAATAEMANVTKTQPVHERDAGPALAATEAFVGQLADDDARDVRISVSGALGWSGESGPDMTIISSNVSVSAYLVAREAS